MNIFKIAMTLVASTLLLSCGNNTAEEPTAPPAVETAKANNFTNYDDQGQAVNYRVCPDNPQQYCARQCTASCQAQPTVVTTTTEVRITRLFVVLDNPLPNPRTCGNQITYDRAGSCEGDNENVVLGSLRVVSPDPEKVHVRWNNNLSERSNDTNQPVAYYRIIVHGKMDKTSSWVSRPIVPNPNSNNVNVTLDLTTVGGSTGYAGTKYVGPLNTTGVLLGARVPLTENAPYWYEIVAYNSDDSFFRGSDQQPITRPFDFVQTNCGGVIVAGYCSLQ